MNPLYNMMNTQQNPLGALFQKAQQLKQSMGGNPMEQIQKLMNSGKITQAQYNKAVQQAESLKKLFQK